jgi:MSHA biogenesis protein MshL
MKQRLFCSRPTFLLIAMLAGVQASGLATGSKNTNAEPEVKIMPRFEIWPNPPKRTNVPPAAVTTPPKAAPAQVGDARKRLYSFRAEGLELKAALAVFARANNLNIVPDLDATGIVTLDVHDLSLDRIMQALLEANDLSWSDEDGLIRVRAAQSRNYVVDYIRLVRSGQGSSAVTLSSGRFEHGRRRWTKRRRRRRWRWRWGGGGGSGGGGQGGSISSSDMNLKLVNQVEFWQELQEQIEKIVTPTGKQTLAINRTAGVIQITDRPSALRRVDSYLDQLRSSVGRQVDIEAKLYDVTLGDQFQWGVDWQRIAAAQGGNLAGLASPFGDPSQLNLTRPFFPTAQRRESTYNRPPSLCCSATRTPRPSSRR